MYLDDSMTPEELADARREHLELRKLSQPESRPGRDYPYAYGPRHFTTASDAYREGDTTADNDLYDELPYDSTPPPACPPEYRADYAQGYADRVARDVAEFLGITQYPPDRLSWRAWRNWIWWHASVILAVACWLSWWFLAGPGS